MTICIATDNYPPLAGGISHFYKYLSTLLCKFGHRVIVLTVDPNSHEDDETTEEEGVMRITFKRSYQQLYTGYKAYFRPGGHDAPHWLASGFAMRRWLLQNAARFSIDLIEVSDYGGLGAFFYGNGLPPYVITGHSSLHQLLPFSHAKVTDHIRVLKRLESRAVSGSKGIIVHSPLNQQSVAAVFQRQPLFARALWQPPEPVLTNPSTNLPLVIGGLQTVKGSVFFADVLQHCKEANRPIAAEWIGYDTFTAPGTSRMSDYLAKAFPGIWQTQLRWLGPKTHRETMQALAVAPFLILPSLWETFNYAALEAASMGKAVVLTKQTGVSYLFTHNHDALLVEAGNKKELAAAIIRLNEDKELCARLGANAKQTVQGYFNPETIYAERMKIYERINFKQQANGEEGLQFLNDYFTPRRKAFYAARAFLKRILKPNSKP